MSGSMGAQLLSSAGLGLGILIGGANVLPVPVLETTWSPKLLDWYQADADTKFILGFLGKRKSSCCMATGECCETYLETVEIEKW